jgi:hypothetical protein
MSEKDWTEPPKETRFSTFDNFYTFWCGSHSWYKHGSWNGILHHSRNLDTNEEYWKFISPGVFQELKTRSSQWYKHEQIRKNANTWQNHVMSKFIFPVTCFVFHSASDGRNMSNYFRKEDAAKLARKGRYLEYGIDKYTSMTKRNIKKVCRLEWFRLREKARRVCVCVYHALTKEYSEFAKSVLVDPLSIIVGQYACDLPFIV